MKYTQLLQEICDELDYDEDEFDPEDLIHEDIKTLKSMSEEEIDKILKALWQATDDLLQEFKNHQIFNYDIDDIKDYFRALYFKDHPDEQKLWDKEGEMSEAFYAFMKNHPDFTGKAAEFIVEGGIIDEFNEELVRKVSEDFDLSSEIIELMRGINGISL
jgi:hypothetical protein